MLEGRREGRREREGGEGGEGERRKRGNNKSQIFFNNKILKKKPFSTFSAVLAEVSQKFKPCSSAKAFPSSVET